MEKLIMEKFTTTKSIKETNIALISDIHYYSNFNTKTFDLIIKQIKEKSPDYTCITGDILDDSSCTKLDNLKEFLNNLSKITPIIIVLGNHDEKTGSMWKWKNQKNDKLREIILNNKNIHLLEDSTYTKDNITFYGFNPSYHHYEVSKEEYTDFEKEVNKLNCKIPNESYNITLLHTPHNIYTFIKNNPNHQLANSDLILSGHMHNGCVPSLITKPINKIFKTTRSIISPKKSLFPKYAQGRVYKIKDGYIYEGITKLANSTKGFHKFNIIYKPKVTFLNIKSTTK